LAPAYLTFIKMGKINHITGNRAIHANTITFVNKLKALEKNVPRSSSVPVLENAVSCHAREKHVDTKVSIYENLPAIEYRPFSDTLRKLTTATLL
jgi:hypothetical protein